MTSLSDELAAKKVAIRKARNSTKPAIPSRSSLHPNGHMGFRRFTLHGLAKVTTEWTLVCTRIQLQKNGRVRLHKPDQPLWYQPQNAKPNRLLEVMLKAENMGASLSWRRELESRIEALESELSHRGTL